MTEPAPYDDTLGVALLSGAGLQPWIWDDVSRMIEVPSVAVRYATERRGMHLGEYARVAVEQIEAARYARVVVVGHSIGGVTGLQVAHVLGDRVVGFLGIAAAVPEPGSSFLSSQPLPQRIALSLAIRVAGTRPPDKAIRSGLCDGLDPALADRVVQTFTPESAELYRDKVPEVALPARGYVTTTRDREFAITQQAQYARRLSGRFIESIDSGHLPMLSAPEQTADAINRFVQTLTG